MELFVYNIYFYEKDFLISITFYWDYILGTSLKDNSQQYLWLLSIYNMYISTAVCR